MNPLYVWAVAKETNRLAQEKRLLPKEAGYLSRDEPSLFLQMSSVSVNEKKDKILKQSTKKQNRNLVEDLIESRR